MKTLEQLQQELDANIPRSSVKQREGAGRKSFSYLSTDYVIARMNSVVGNLNWSTDTQDNRCVFEGQVNGKHCVSYIARVKIEAQHIDENGRVIRTSHTGTGYGDGSDANNPGKAHELAAKEAESDALKRACKNLGQSMGLALYDKDQTNVEDDAPAGKSAPQARPTAASEQAARPASVPNSTSRPSAAGQHESRPQGAPSNRDTLNKSIATLAKIVNSKGVATFDAIKANMREAFGTDVKEQLTDEQAAKLKADLERMAG